MFITTAVLHQVFSMWQKRSGCFELQADFCLTWPKRWPTGKISKIQYSTIPHQIKYVERDYRPHANTSCPKETLQRYGSTSGNYTYQSWLHTGIMGELALHLKILGWNLGIFFFSRNECWGQWIAKSGNHHITVMKKENGREYQAEHMF